MSRIKKLRLLSGMTQEILAEKLEISQSHLSLLERNKREITPEINRKLEDLFSLSVKFMD
ncbi:helix-turn-helix transcriptional regulator [Schinkia azotoformans]|uniref:helix-turn-helix domain-containing protein n=1 Tax=Schinkia azotoformans TaxID=1454 RepID=UPI002DB765C8|nr:helix-turn-helix transcriptional regulator [Schinkia azotoformans]MEC1726941.1 helix-turn-helix transcriptional regulator [Schinkia azotoformans]